MYKCADIPIKLDIRAPADPAIVRSQLELNGRLGKSLVDLFLKDAKEYVVRVRSTDFGTEASIFDEKGKTNFIPGFYVAKDQYEVTVRSELARAAQYISDKFVNKMRFVGIQPVVYTIDGIDSVSLGQPDPKTGFRNGVVHTVVKPHGIDVKLESEFWNGYVVPKLTDPYDRGKAVKALAEAFEHQSNTLRLPTYTPAEKENRRLAKLAIYCMLEMMSTHALKPASSMNLYQAKDGRYCLNDSLEFSIFYDPKLAKQVFDGKTRIEVPMA